MEPGRTQAPAPATEPAETASRIDRSIDGRGRERDPMLAEFTGVLLMLGIALLIAGGMIGAHKLLGPRRSFQEKLDPFECGEKQIVSPHQRFSVKFYLVAMLFVIFDLEGSEPLVVGLLYEWRKGALEW